MSSIKATENGFIDHQGETFPCIKGTSMTGSEHKKVTLFPGEIPKDIPKREFWQNNPFNFVSFEPAKSTDKQLAHIRMDHVIEYLLGDKLR
jgi:predicted YcjX-like family ATPase